MGILTCTMSHYMCFHSLVFESIQFMHAALFVYFCTLPIDPIFPHDGINKMASTFKSMVDTLPTLNIPILVEIGYRSYRSSR